jgi:hypothetical protein
VPDITVTILSGSRDGRAPEADIAILRRILNLHRGTTARGVHAPRPTGFRVASPAPFAGYESPPR